MSYMAYDSLHQISALNIRSPVGKDAGRIQSEMRQLYGMSVKVFYIKPYATCTRTAFK